MMGPLEAADAKPKTVMIDAAYLEARRTAWGLRVERDLGRLIGPTHSRVDTKVHTQANAQEHPLSFLMTFGRSATTPGQPRC